MKTLRIGSVWRVLALGSILTIGGALAWPGRSSVKLTPLGEAGASAQPGPGDYERSLDHAGRHRRYELHVPLAYDARKPLPLVLNLHGGGGNGSGARRGTHMDKTADREGFLVCYPDGTGRFERRGLTWNGGLCCGKSVTDGVDDVGFLRAVIADASRFFKVDSKRVYSTGLSNGAIMSYRLACDLAGEIAAIAPVSGPMELLDCRPLRPVPILHIHGTEDNNARYDGGVGSHSLTRHPFQSVGSTIAKWVEMNRADPAAKVERKGNVRTDLHAPRPGGAEVVLITIEGHGHIWPGGDPLLPRFIVGEDTAGFSASDRIWEFFKRHALP